MVASQWCGCELNQQPSCGKAETVHWATAPRVQVISCFGSYGRQHLQIKVDHLWILIRSDLFGGSSYCNTVCLQPTLLAKVRPASQDSFISWLFQLGVLDLAINPFRGVCMFSLFRFLFFLVQCPHSACTCRHLNLLPSYITLHPNHNYFKTVWYT